MIVVSRRNLLIPSPDGSQKFHLPRGYMGPVPDWAAKTAYFKALVADGKIVVSETKKPAKPEKPAAEGEA